MGAVSGAEPGGEPSVKKRSVGPREVQFCRAFGRFAECQAGLLQNPIWANVRLGDNPSRWP